ncbi:MAG: L-arabinose isomerase [Bacilli bacterium]|nr:L-arabinose isomerase [Bacilli bacterium]
MAKQEFWFIVGSQHLYGEAVLKTVEKRAQEMAKIINTYPELPAHFVFKTVVKTSDDATKIIKEANYDDNCLGIVTWCHTFSPSKMWINGLKLLQKPWCHLATQYNQEIPNQEIDMDFMNLNQAAHGDREHGFIGARLRINHKVIMGYWKDKNVLHELSHWMRSAIGYHESSQLRVMRFGDNMRNVAVTEGDKVEAQIKLGWEVNTWAVGDLVKEMKKVKKNEIDALMKIYQHNYDIKTKHLDLVRYQALEEIAMKKMLEREHCLAFTNTFEDLYGMEQLPGLATQHLMSLGYGYGGEGDWKVSAMTHIIKKMTEGMGGGTSFMEDYTYNLVKGKEYSLGAHMLEVCPSLASQKPRIETHHLGIGMNQKDPARLVFAGKPGKATVTSLIDMGGRLRMIVQDIEVVKSPYSMPNLPTARVLWKAYPSLQEGAKLWIMAGGAHHTVLSMDATPTMLKDLASMWGIEFVHISKDTTASQLKAELDLYDLAWRR